MNVCIMKVNTPYFPYKSKYYYINFEHGRSIEYSPDYGTYFMFQDSTYLTIKLSPIKIFLL